MPEAPYTQDATDHVQHMQRTAPAETELELYDKLTLGDNSLQDSEFSGYLSTGFCDEEEIRILRILQSLYVRIRTIEQEADDGVKFRRLKRYILRRMAFITHSSKNRDGFAIKQVGTQRVYSNERVDARHEQKGGEKQSLIDRLLGAGKRARGSEVPDVLGDMPEPMETDSRRNVDYYGGGRREEDPLW